MSSEPMSVADAKQLVRDVFHQTQRDASKLRNGAIEIALREFEWAVREAAPATPAATPMAATRDWKTLLANVVEGVDPFQAGPDGDMCCWCMRERDREIESWEDTRKADYHDADCEFLIAVEALKSNVAVAMNESAPQNLPAAAQPQRESEQPEQALREARIRLNEQELHGAHARDCETFTRGGTCDCGYVARITELRAALSPQTDSQETK